MTSAEQTVREALEVLRMGGFITSVLWTGDNKRKYQAKLRSGIRWTPDFICTRRKEREVYWIEVKARSGRWMSGSRDSIVRVKAVKDAYPHVRILWVEVHPRGELQWYEIVRGGTKRRIIVPDEL